MKVPTLTDRVVKVRGYITDDVFGYDHWRAAQFSAPDVESRDCILLVYPTKRERDAAFQQLTAAPATS